MSDSGLRNTDVGHQATPPGSLTVRLEPDELDGGWVVSVVELPGCMSEGETVAEALRNIAEAYEGVTSAD